MKGGHAVVRPGGRKRVAGPQSDRTGKVLIAVGVIGLLLRLGVQAEAYQQYGVQVGSRVQALKWSRMPIRYFVTDSNAPGVDAGQLQAAVDRAFSTWHRVTTASVSSEFVGFSRAQPFDDDGMSTLGFLDEPDLDRVLGATELLIDITTGEIIESDIFFNAAFAWSVSPSGEPGRFDLESIALHEIGHMFGLGHSALGETELRPSGGRRVIAAESVMFPIAMSAGNVSDRTLRADDIAGISELYPASGFRRTTGTISGRVVMNGRGVFGAHVVAFSPETGRLVAGFTVDDQGRFGIAGLDPGPQIVRVEPLDDADLDSFFNDSSGVDLDFRVSYADRSVIAPRGGASGPIEITVAPK